MLNTVQLGTECLKNSLLLLPRAPPPFPPSPFLPYGTARVLPRGPEGKAWLPKGVVAGAPRQGGPSPPSPPPALSLSSGSNR